MGQVIIVKGADYSALNLGKIELPFVGSSDADVNAYLTAIGESLTSERARAYNKAVLAMKANGIWSLIDSAYTFSGDTGAKVSVNLKKPIQSASINTNNIVAGGVNLDNATSPILLNNNIPVTPTGHICVYNKNLEVTGQISVLVSSKSGPALTGPVLARNLNGSSYASSFVATSHSISAVNEIGTFIATFNGTTNKIFSKGVLKASTAKTLTANTTEELYLGANTGGSGIYKSACTMSFVSIGQGLSDAQVAIYDGIIETLVAEVHS